MSKATIQAKFGGKRVASGSCQEGPTPKKLQALVNSQNTKDNSAVISKEQQTR